MLRLILQVSENFLLMFYFCFESSKLLLMLSKASIVAMHRLNLPERTNIIEFWHQVKCVKQVRRLFCDLLWCPHA